MASLRAHLEAHAAGTAPARGNVLAEKTVDQALPFARACRALWHESLSETGERFTAPSELLAPLP